MACPKKQCGTSPIRWCMLLKPSRARRQKRKACWLSYSANTSELFRQVAIYVDKILRGASPADLPVEQRHGLSYR